MTFSEIDNVSQSTWDLLSKNGIDSSQPVLAHSKIGKNSKLLTKLQDFSKILINSDVVKSLEFMNDIGIKERLNFMLTSLF